MRNSTKLKIKSIVEEYKLLFPADYMGTCEVVKHQRANMRDEYAAVLGTHILHRALYSISELLSGMIGQRLNEGEITEMSEKPSQRWFAKTYKEFCLADKI